MTYSTFALYNVTGGIIWLGICTLAGYAFGNVPIVRDNFTVVALGIVFVSLLPILVGVIYGIGASQRRELDAARPTRIAGPESRVLQLSLRRTASNT